VSAQIILAAVRDPRPLRAPRPRIKIGAPAGQAPLLGSDRTPGTD